MKTTEEMIMSLDSALNFNDVKKLMIQYAEEALKEAAERAEAIDNSDCEPNVDKDSILNIIKELK